MDIKVNQVAPVPQVNQTENVQAGDGTFKFILASNIAEQDLQVRLSAMMQEITQQGQDFQKNGCPRHEKVSSVDQRLYE